jgi:hypothetical protein
LLEALNSARQLRVGLPNPALNTTGLAALLAIADLTAGDPRARTELARLARTLSQNSAEDVAELFTRLPKSADPATIADSIAAIPATEQSVWRYNTAKPAVPLVAVYPSEGALQLDYPYVVTTSPDDRNRQRIARRLLAALQAPAAQEILRPSAPIRRVSHRTPPNHPRPSSPRSSRPGRPSACRAGCSSSSTPRAR